MSECPMCKKRGKTWNGGDPVCAFPDGVFTPRNWNCATANALRDLCGEWSNNNEDQNAAILLGSEECLHVVISWYKRCGATDAMWMMIDDETPQPLTLKEAEKIILKYEQIEAKEGK